jgi:signal transduction histidine kinase
MKISNYNQLLAISTLLSGMVIFVTLWSQYQKVEAISRSHFESRLTVQTINHLFTMSQVWLTTQDLLFSDRQTYLAKGISEQSSLLLQSLASIDMEEGAKERTYLIKQLITAIQKNEAIVNSFSQLSTENIPAWHERIAASDRVTIGYVENLERLYAQVISANKNLSKKLASTTTFLTKLTWVLVSLYLIFILSVVTWFSKYIVKPIENITALAQQSSGSKQSIEFRQDKAPKEIIDLSAAIQQFTQHITIEKQKVEQEHLNVVRVNEKVHTIMDTIPCALLLLDEQGIIIECNGETERLLARSKHQIINSYVADFLPVLATLDGKFDTEATLKNMEESLLAPCFDKPYVEFSGRKIAIKGAVNYLVTISDINERKHSQKALSALSEQLVNAEKLASIGQLSAGIAHEINNPVGYIRSNLDILKDYFIPIVSYIKLANAQTQKSSIKALYEEEDIDFIINDIEPLITATLDGAARVSKIIKDLGNYAHADNKDPELVLIDELIEQSLSLVANELKYKVEISKDLNARVAVMGFPQKLLQVFINMLVNASHAIKTTGRILISSSSYQDEVHLSFEDNGTGIYQSDLKKIFDPFFTTKPVGKGTGLGLHIVRTIIDEHKGRIDVSSIINKGSKFDIYLPIHRAK